jgi:hypothetical protein
MLVAQLDSDPRGRDSTRRLFGVGGGPVSAVGRDRADVEVDLGSPERPEFLGPQPVVIESTATL